MVDEMCSSINYLSQKLEQLPLANYLFLAKPLGSNTKRELNSPRLFCPNNTKERHPSNRETFVECFKDKIANAKNSQFEDEEEEGKNKYRGETCTTLLNNKQRPRCTPTFSNSLPVTHIKKSSPNKRKRSPTENLNNEDDCLSFTRSCDFEVSDICNRDFRSIQRTLSFDDDLLRYENKHASSPISWNSPKSRPSYRLTCKSQPSFVFERYTAVRDVKPRKVKIVQVPNDDVNVGKTLPLLLSNTQPTTEHTFKSINSQIDTDQHGHAFKSIDRIHKRHQIGNTI